VQKGDGRREKTHKAEAYDDDMTLSFEQLLKLTFLKSEYPLNPVLVCTGFTGSSESSTY
jgi:hypothetical protein